jgi:hypothetical protein
MRQLYPQEGEVPAVLNAGYLQVTHDNLTVFIVLAQSSVLLFQVRQRAQFILCSCTHCKDKRYTGHYVTFNDINNDKILTSSKLFYKSVSIPQIKIFQMSLKPIDHCC